MNEAMAFEEGMRQFKESDASRVPARSCAYTGVCLPFLVYHLKDSLPMWRSFYCHDKFPLCARYQKAASGRPIPFNLLPNGGSAKPGGTNG